MLQKILSNTNDLPAPKYKAGEIVVIKINGIEKKRHIYADPIWNTVKNTDDKVVIEDYYYPVDYGLGCTSEGYAWEFSMRKSISPKDDHLVL